MKVSLKSAPASFLTGAVLLATSSFAFGSITLIEDLLTDFTGVTTGDYTIRNSTSQGRLFVNGTFNRAFNNSVAVNTSVPHPNDNVSLYARDFNLTGSARQVVQNGGVVTSSSISQNRFELQGQGNPTPFINGHAGASATENLLSSYGTSRSSFTHDVEQGSIDLANLASNATVTRQRDNQGNLNGLSFNAGSGLVIFDIAASELFAQNVNPNINVSAQNDAVIINVRGTGNVTQNNNNFNFSGNQNFAYSRVIWNFYQADGLLDLDSIGGSVVAPQADVFIQGRVDGATIGRTLTHEGQLHIPTFGGMIVPEPSSGLLASLLLFGFAVTRRSR